jgi:hypothetical protein
MHKNSECIGGHMHRWVIVKEWPQGVEEVCDVCRKTMFAHFKIPNHIYLASHLRSILKPSDSRFKYEY